MKDKKSQTLEHMPQPRSLFIFYLESENRRRVLACSSAEEGERYLLYGIDRFRKRGFTVHHNLETPTRLNRKIHIASFLLNKIVGCAGAVGGDFRSVIAFRKEANGADVILSTVDTVGIPVVLLHYFKPVRAPIVYVSIGLPERLMRFRNEFARDLYRRTFSSVDAIIAYGFEEANFLRDWLKSTQAEGRVHFVPFGVDCDYFRPYPGSSPEVDVVSIGADPERDFHLLISFVESHPEISVRIITTTLHAESLGNVPGNVELLQDIPFLSIRDHMANARIIVLPIKGNSYSGATTTLLQAMAMAKPVVVSRVGAISRGYHLEDGVNCMLVTPHNKEELDKAIMCLLENLTMAEEIGKTARNTVERHLNWDCYVDNLLSIIDKSIQARKVKEQ